MDYARGTISQDFTTTVENLVHMFSRIDQIKDEMNNISGEIEVLTKLEPLGIDLDLLVGYSSITSFVGTCLKPSQITDMKPRRSLDSHQQRYRGSFLHSSTPSHDVFTSWSPPDFNHWKSPQAKAQCPI